MPQPQNRPLEPDARTMAPRTRSLALVFAALAAYASLHGATAFAAAFIGVLCGLVPTMMHLALARRRTVVPALPLSVAIGCALLAINGYALSPFAWSVMGHNAQL